MYKFACHIYETFIYMLVLLGNEHRLDWFMAYVVRLFYPAQLIVFILAMIWNFYTFQSIIILPDSCQFHLA